jgi:hypothetical protein
MLPTKFVAAETTISQPTPHELFCLRIVTTQLPCPFNVGHVANLGKAIWHEKFVLLGEEGC